jgi:hypothetical protein
MPKSITKNCELKLLHLTPFPLSGTIMREKKRLSMMYYSHNMAADGLMILINMCKCLQLGLE